MATLIRAAHIDLILPVLNPPINWAVKTHASHLELERIMDARVNLIIVDDGSIEQLEIGKLGQLSPEATVLFSRKNFGKGHALRLGVDAAKSDCIIFTDADFPYELASIKAVANELINGADVALGHREQDYYASVPWFRKGLSESFRFVLKSILKFPVTDTQCGLKGINKTGKTIFMQTNINRFLVDMEFIKLAVQKKVNISPVVVQLRPNVEFSKMGIGVLIPELINFIKVIFL